MTTKRKKTKQSRSARSVWALVLFLIVVYVAYEPLSQALTKEADPDAATGATIEPSTDRSRTKVKNVEIPARLTDRPEKVLKRRPYTTSFNQQTNLPNWVAWELTPDQLVERESRTNDFLPDPDLPSATAVTTADYKGSGYDRGHMCPAGDNKWHWKAMRESFYMTNICPQNGNLNRGDWKELEEKCRDWATQLGCVYIVCGPLTDDSVEPKTIGSDHQVVVPTGFFKVVLCTACEPAQAIGFIFKNEAGSRPLYKYACTVDEVERRTGMDFFPALPDSLEAAVESRFDYARWP